MSITLASPLCHNMTCASLQDKQVYSGESGIFQWEWGANSIGVGANLLFGNFFPKLHEIERNWTERRVLVPHRLDSIQGSGYIATQM